MSDQPQDVVVGAPVASAITAVPVPGSPTLRLIDPPMCLSKVIRTHVQTILSIGGSSISSVSPPRATAIRSVRGVTSRVAPLAVCEAA